MLSPMRDVPQIVAVIVSEAAESLEKLENIELKAFRQTNMDKRILHCLNHGDSLHQLRVVPLCSKNSEDRYYGIASF